jgi:NAD+ kinase
MGMVGTVGLVLHPRRDSEMAIGTILDWAKQRSATVLGLPGEIGRIDCSAVPVSDEELVDRSDLLVSLGGDGTMLRTLRMLVGGPKTPVLGVNLGRLGFLAEVDVADLPPALCAIDEHRYQVEPRMAVRAELSGQSALTAFNDLAMVRVPGEGMAEVAVTVAGHPFVRYAADAVIVATSTGSTAYSFSAGGPIVSPSVPAYLVVPASAHSTFNRALVLPADDTVELQLLAGSGRLAVEMDGVVAGHLGPGDRVRVTAVPDAAHIVRLGTTTFYERARRKLRLPDSAEVAE